MTDDKTSFWTPSRIGAGGTWRFGIVYSGYAHQVTLDEVVTY